MVMSARTWPFWLNLGVFKKRMYQTIEGGQSLEETVYNVVFRLIFQVIERGCFLALISLIRR